MAWPGPGAHGGPSVPQWTGAQDSPGSGCGAPRRSSAAPAPSRSCGRRPRSTPPRRRRCSSPGCSSGTRPGRGSRQGRPPQTRSAGPRPPSPRPLRPAAGPPPPCGLAPARLLPTSEAGTPPPSSPGRARRSQRGPAPVGRALGRCGRPASPSLDRRRGLRGQLRAQVSPSPAACARSGARSPAGGRVPASAPEGAGRVLRACSGDPPTPTVTRGRVESPGQSGLFANRRTEQERVRLWRADQVAAGDGSLVLLRRHRLAPAAHGVRAICWVPEPRPACSFLRVSADGSGK